MPDIAPIRRIYPFTHSACDGYFKPSSRDFVVREIPLYEPSGSGEHCLLYVRKKGLSTFELLYLLSQILGCKVRDIGYAGLKDKAATTYQYISIHHSLLPRLESARATLEEKQVKILNITFHHNKLKIGHLKGNAFFMRLKKCSPTNAKKLESILQSLTQSGFPNYFGNQRFGNEGDNFQSGRELAHNAMEMKNKKINKFLISSYQSYLFNAWLSCRITLSQILHHFSPNEAMNDLQSSSLPALQHLNTQCNPQMLKIWQAQKQPFVLLKGDVMCHYPFGKTFLCEDENIESARFMQRYIAPTGALYGTKCINAQDMALVCEAAYKDKISASGSRRYAWVWAEDVESKYKPQEAHFELRFTLPKGSYATIFLESLLGKSLEICRND